MRVFIPCPRASMRSFRSAESGGVAIIFAVALFPLLGLLGAGIDFSYASLVRASLRSSIDATGLMLSKTAQSQTAAQLQTSAEAYFRANFNHPDVTQPTIVATYSATPTPTVTISGATSVNPFFMGIMGVDKIDVAANTTVKWGNTKLRVALALDVTLSMLSAGKMTAMKTAAKSFLTQMQAAATNNGDVYASIIPFNKDVNVRSLGDHNLSWLRWTGVNGWDDLNGECDDDDWDTKTECESHHDDWDTDSHSSWNGCVMDRDMDHDTRNTAPTTAATRFPTEDDSDCPAQLMALSFNWTSLKAKIDALVAKGTTNQAIGLAWAFQSLTASPFTIPAKDPNYNYNEVIILMTDGANTASRHYPSGASASANIDARQAILCQRIKDPPFKIIIYTVQVATGGEAKIPMLETCASDPGKFFLLRSASDLVATFNKIATELKSVYIAY